ncbi:hypothetical protein [uncultured Pseudokineococcus sp.]|uniref:hypothetical protein n=1 Tax=uncultured Pseudokineococcus sp. TaxID=1642928 RepID=UPI00260EFF74|nr:hypothetical protein [uncultured Pseudokineococcus sp.]
MLRIHPTLRRCWRDVGRVQLGADPAHARVLDGLGAADEALLDDLVHGVPEEGLAARAADRGVSADAASHLVGLLAAAGALEPASAPGARAAARATAAEARAQALVHGVGGWDVLARRALRRVVVEGRGRVPDAVRTGLEEAGTGVVDLRATGGGGPGAGAAGTSAAGEADLVVLVADGAPPPARAAQLLRADADHLAVVLRERSAVVGPLVVPGRTACLRCLDLHRADRDPEWPRVAAQLAHPVAGGGRPDVVLLRLTTALVVAQALAHLDAAPPPSHAAAHGRAPDRGAPARRGGRPTAPAPATPAPRATGGRGTTRAGGGSTTTAAARGRTWELALPDGLPVGREWHPHPACGCTWPPR